MKSMKKLEEDSTLQTYQIKLQGCLDESWSGWLAGMGITIEKTGDIEITILTGSVIDQAALFGVLNRIRDLNMTLLSVRLCDVPYESETT